jgi:DNA-directed RNA polymerase subunit RPC12/RpoP
VRLIDADVFAERMIKQWDTASREKRLEIVSVIANIVTPILIGTPTADAEVVRHGRWIENGDDDMDAGMWHCSECGHEIYSDLSLMEEMQEQGYALYCEHCGAKMDGGARSEP